MSVSKPFHIYSFVINCFEELYNFQGFPTRQQPFLLSHDLNSGVVPGSAPLTSTSSSANGGHWVPAANYHNNGPQGGGSHR